MTSHRRRVQLKLHVIFFFWWRHYPATDGSARHISGQKINVIILTLHVWRCDGICFPAFPDSKKSYSKIKICSLYGWDIKCSAAASVRCYSTLTYFDIFMKRCDTFKFCWNSKFIIHFCVVVFLPLNVAMCIKLKYATANSIIKLISNVKIF